MLRRLSLLVVAVSGLLALQLASVAQPAPAPAAEVGNTLRIAFAPNESPSLDPHCIRDPLSFRLVATAYETLYMYAPGPATGSGQARVVPCLAKDFPKVSEDGLTVTIKVDTSAKFHSSVCFGEARTRNLKASDFVHSFKRMAVFKEQGMYWMATGLIKGLDEYGATARDQMLYETTDTKVEGLEAPDDETLVLKLTRPFGPIVTLLAHPTFCAVPREAMDHFSGLLRERAVGTGPYRLNAVAENKLYLFKRWDDYRGEKAAFERVTFTVRNFWNEFLNGYTSGTLHEMPVWASYYDRIAKEGKPAGALEGTSTEIIEEDEHGYYFLAFNMQDELWGAMDADGRALRRAVSLCIDREELLVNAGFDRKWSSPQAELFPAGMEFEDAGKGLEFGKQDLDAAKKALEGSKYKGGKDPATGKALTLTFLTTDAGIYEQIANSLRTGLKALGMRLDVHYVDSSELRDMTNTAEEQLLVAGWFLDYPDPFNYLQLFWSANAANGEEFNNHARYKSAEFDKLFGEYEKLQATEQNAVQRRELVAAMGREIAKDQPIIPLIRRRSARIRSTLVEWPAMPRQTFNDIRFARGKK
ncbi:MAG: ABC transporter substrate-binding protein [Planctomycetes bacterium]|nr:ABC transporter substrate-binding protein [Planctomycetota bacterium]